MPQQNSEERKGAVKRKLEAMDTNDGASSKQAAEDCRPLVGKLSETIVNLSKNALTTSAPPTSAERSGLRKATHQLSEMAKSEEKVDAVVEGGAVRAVVPLLTMFKVDEGRGVSTGEDVEKEACFILGLLAIKQEHQHAIADAGAIPGLITLLGRHCPTSPPPSGGGPPPGASVVRRAADAITNLSHENVVIKSRVRADGGIAPLVSLLDSPDPKVQRAAAGALRTLAFKNEENKNVIVEGGALPTLVQMLKSDDPGIHYEAVGVVGNLVHSSQHIKRRVLEEGALQPVIGLLSSRCGESQREAALLLGQFATTEPDFKAKIVQRGAVPPLVEMLSAGDAQLQEMAAFALGRLAQNVDNQAGVVQAGAIKPLLALLASRNGNLQHNAAFALYGLADSDDNVTPLVKEGAVQALLDCELLVQPSKDCVQKTLKRLEDKAARPAVLATALFAMRGGDRASRERVAAALARLVSRDEDLRSVFVDRRGLDVLLGLLTDPSRDPGAQREAAGALFELAKKANATAPIDCAPAPPTPQVYLGEQYVNNPTLSDVTFVVEGRTFHAHRIALLASSDTFRAMFDGHYREKDASEIPIPNISFPVFEAMMRCVYTGSVEVEPALAQDLLRAADQYMLEGLKRLCEASLAGSLTVAGLRSTYELSEAFSAPQLGRRCVLFALEKYDAVSAALEPAGFCALMRRMVPKLRESLTEQMVLKKEQQAAAAGAGAGGATAATAVAAVAGGGA